MIRGLVIRPAQESDRAAIRNLVTAAFGQTGEADLVEALVRDGDSVLELVATHEQIVVGHVLFSRLMVEEDGREIPAVALAPIAVDPTRWKSRIGTTLIENAHALLRGAGERLSVVLGDPAYYGRFGYRHERAADFASDYQCEELQALAWGEAPKTGRLHYARAFAGL